MDMVLILILLICWNKLNNFHLCLVFTKWDFLFKDSGLLNNKKPNFIRLGRVFKYPLQPDTIIAELAVAGMYNVQFVIAIIALVFAQWTVLKRRGFNS
ncbi:hypothetical protein AM500_19225 [Bacillus sp. FJAT-18017]|nr:hypothetical protein AM500_19225 [Bacillus sp. FJAT-18017]